MTRPRVRLRSLLVAAALVAALAPPADARERWDTDVLALVPRPGYPAHAYVHPNGNVYEGTYDNPSGDNVPSRVLEYSGEGQLLRSWTVEGQDLSGPHGVQAATSDVRGRLVLLDKNPPRALLLDPGPRVQTTYATFPAGSIPNYAAWGVDGSLYVTDFGQPILWRIPPGGGTPERWLTDPRLDGGDFGTTGLNLAADRRTLLVAVQSGAGGGSGGNPSAGRIFRVPIEPDGRPGAMTQLWESRPLDGPDGFGVARSGNLYVALLPANQLAVVGPDGRERERFPSEPGSGENGSSVPFDSPSSARFLGTRLIVAQQSFFAGDPSHQAILDVEAGEEGLPELIPPNAGLKDAIPPVVKQVRLSARRLRFRLSEPAELEVLVERTDRGRWTRVRERFVQLGGGTRVLSVPALAGKPRGLRPGKWRLSLLARDGEGNVGRTVRRALRVRRPRS